MRTRARRARTGYAQTGWLPCFKNDGGLFAEGSLFPSAGAKPCCANGDSSERESHGEAAVKGPLPVHLLHHDVTSCQRVAQEGL